MDAVAYWLEDDEGYPVWWERESPDAALSIAARGFENGLDPDMVVLVARTGDGDRQVVATGPELREMALPFKPIRSPGEEAAVTHLRRALSGPLDIKIDGATKYWVESADGRRRSDEMDRSNAALLVARELIAGGWKRHDLILVCRLKTGRRYEITRGDFLAEFADRAAGIPARPRRITRGPPYPRGTSRESGSPRPTDR